MNERLDKLVQEWLDWDQDPLSRKEIETLLQKASWPELEARFSSRMEFGTSGLRAAMGAGSSRMNNLTVIQATQGFSKYLETVLTSSVLRKKGVVIGYDARHHSKIFALHAAQVFLLQKVKVYLYSDIVPTPFVPYLVKRLSLAAGIMVTASHNPKEDNGYKVYWGNGAQIIPPHDSGIAREIEKNLKPWENVWLFCGEQNAPEDEKSIATNAEIKIRKNKSLCYDPLDDVMKSYYQDMKSSLSFLSQEEKSASAVRFVYTAMHGVGYVYAKKAFQAFQLRPFHDVLEQIQPNPDFPTVRFPNPEEGKSALELSIKTAKQCKAQVILANDPDADRLAIAELTPDGSCRVFSGNEIATLLAWWLWENMGKPENEKTGLSQNRSEKKQKTEGVTTRSQKQPERKTGTTQPNHETCIRYKMIASTVSSKMLQAMGSQEGFDFEDCLTGFKWIANRAIESEKSDAASLENTTTRVIFGYEEAIGFMCGMKVPDKDGISALAVFSELAVFIYSLGKYSSPARLDANQNHDKGGPLALHLLELQKKYGYFCSNNSYYICHDKKLIASIFERIRNQGNYFSHLGPYKIAGIRDLTAGYDSRYEDKKPRLPVSKTSQMITFYFENHCVLTLRTSGTEPKIKYYSELPGKIQTSLDISKIQKKLDDMIQIVIRELIDPEKNKLQPQQH